MTAAAVNGRNCFAKYLAEQTCSSSINNPTIKLLPMPTVESPVICRTSSTRKSGGAPVWHWFPVNPELQLHEKLPTVFTHEPPLRQAALYSGTSHKSSTETQIVIRSFNVGCLLTVYTTSEYVYNPHQRWRCIFRLLFLLYIAWEIYQLKQFLFNLLLGRFYVIVWLRIELQEQR